MRYLLLGIWFAGVASAGDLTLTYVPARGGEPPVQVVGQRIWQVQQHDVALAEGVATARLAYAGGALHLHVSGMTGDAPTLRVGASAAAAKAATPLPAEDYRIRRAGFLRVRSTRLVSGRTLRLFVVVRDEAAFAVLHDLGAWRGALTVGERTLPVWSWDTDGDGRPGDLVFLDADADGVVTRAEVVGADETLLVGAHAVRLTRAAGALRAVVAPRAEATGRDVLAALKVAPMAGRAMPAFRFTDQDGRTVDSARLKGKVVIFHFWCTL